MVVPAQAVRDAHISAVIAGLDPAIHLLQESFEE
jgi:hypothetical protein